MERNLEYRKRQDLILSFIIESYVSDGKPISSALIKDKYDLPYSPATIRNVMTELDDMGYIMHVHTSSGRVPTQEGFRYYINFLMPRKNEYLEILQQDMRAYKQKIQEVHDVDEIIDMGSKIISDMTHHAGIGFCENNKEKVYLRGAHYMFDHPEFESMAVLKQLFTALEDSAGEFWNIFDKKISKDTYVFIGDELGVVKTDSCSMIVTPVNINGAQRVMFGVLGPMRMNYREIIGKIGVLKDTIEDIYNK